MGNNKSKTYVQSNTKKNEAIMRRLKTKKKLHYITTAVVFAVAFFAVWYSNNRNTFPDDTTRSLVVAAICTLSLGGLAFSLWNWRCPACGKYLGRTMDPQKCRKCGVKLR